MSLLVNSKGKPFSNSLLKKATGVAFGLVLALSSQILAQQGSPPSLEGGLLEDSVIYSLRNPTQALLAAGNIQSDAEVLSPVDEPNTEENDKSAENIVGKNAALDAGNKVDTDNVSSGKGSFKIEKLSYFGYDIFSNSQGLSVGNYVIDNSYRVGPGDLFQISVWGSEEASFTAEINSNGELLMPTFGKVKTRGLSYAGLKNKVRELISRDLTGFELSVNAIRPRRNEIYVVGEVRNPGVYELGGTSTSLTALFAAGGPKVTGTLRKIEIRRGKKIIGKFDCYDFLTKGSRATDVTLRAGDTVFVPMAGPRVKVAGAVKRPAIYELKNGEMTLGDVIEVAGGIIPIADLQKIQIQRFMAHSQEVVFSREISRDDNRFAGNSTVVQDMDLIRVFAISPRNREMVTLEGHVFEPGARPWTNGIMLSQILTNAYLLKQDPALEYGEILREGGLGGEYQVVSFNPGKILAGDLTADVELQPKDRIVIFPSSMMKNQAKVSITGAIVNPGTVDFTDGMRIKDLIYRCGGLKDGANMASAELSRQSIKDGKLVSNRLDIDISKALKNDSRHNLVLKPFDSLIVRKVAEWTSASSIVIKGEVKFPGTYSFQLGEKLSSVIKRAGGFTNRAYLKGAVFIRESIRRAQEAQKLKLLEGLKEEENRYNTNRKFDVSSNKNSKAWAAKYQKDLTDVIAGIQPSGRMIIKLDKLAVYQNSSMDIEVEPGDELTIPGRPSSVIVEGAVYNSMATLWEVNKSVRYYLNKVGGTTSNADRSNVHLVRVDGSVVSGRTVRNFLNKTIVEPGDTVVVPTKIRAPRNRWQRTMNITKTISSFLLTAIAIDRWND